MMPSSVRPEVATRAFRSALLKGSCIAALALTLPATPAVAQLAGVRAALGIPNNVGGQAGSPTNVVTTVTPTMGQILARHQNYELRVQQAAGLVAQANAAARAAATSAAQSIPNGLGAGGLQPVMVTFTSAQDPTGLKVWEGADKPTQTTIGTAVDVNVKQTQSRALLSWETFNVGANTTLTFNQQGNAGWIAVNRVVGAIDPVTGLVDRTKDINPSQILGSIKADGSVFILNRAGVMFGANAQVNLHSLLASSLELGSATIQQSAAVLRRTTLQERNDSFLLNGLLPNAVSGLVSSVAGEQHGDVTVASGARLNASGGYVVLAGPKVTMAGEVKATGGGQVSLEAGKQVDVTTSSGAAGSADPNVRGLILSSRGGGSVNVTGSIDAAQGYISLGTDFGGTINMGGVLTSTTSVARNGKISLIGGTVNIGTGAAISITPDSGGATIPQSADSLAAFKSSQIDIGSHDYGALRSGRISTGTDAVTFDLLPAVITIGANSTIRAPNANVSIGGRAGDATRLLGDNVGLATAKVDVLDNAVVDVSGVADVVLATARNMLEISPAKRNELRDTPTYRDPTTNQSFTLNGQILFVDPRLSGVRADGVAWIGSPLVEAGSLAAQIGVTAPELMTRGGNVTLATLGLKQAPATGDYIPAINVSSNAVIDFSGGWVRYAAGNTHYSKLLTADGRLIDISKADPNDNFVSVANGFSEQLPQLNDPTVFANPVLQGDVFQPGYIEGRDAGSLTIKTPTGSLNGTFHGDAVAGDRQIGTGIAASKAATLAGDIRKLQAVAAQLPSAGLLHIQSIPGGDIVVGATTGAAGPGMIMLDNAKLNAANLGGLSLQTSGKVTLDASTDLKLAPGGAFNLDAGRTISFNGKVSAPAGTITARTYGVLLGNVFDLGDNLPANGMLTSATLPRMFDIVVANGATLSTRGRWVNDSLVTDGLYGGSGYASGGSISLISAPHIAALMADGSGAVDLSGSILLKSGSLLDVSGGGYVSPTGNFALSGKGGNVSLINETSYFQKAAVGNAVDAASPFRSDLTTFQVSPDPAHAPAIVPGAINAAVTIDGDIRSFGFTGGGIFTLVTPNLKFGSSDGDGTRIGLDFLPKTGFGTLALTTWKTAFLDNVFSNGAVGKTALLATQKVQIRGGETLDLTQSVLPSLLTADQVNILRAQASGTDISRLAELAPTNQLGNYDNHAANLILGGLTELEVLGGTITGAPTASITAARIYNAGTIRIAGGSLIQRLVLPSSYVAAAGSRAAIGVQQQLNANGIDRGAGLATVFGQADSAGKFNENALNAAGLTSSADGSVLTNRDLVSLNGQDRQVYYLGMLGADQGIVLAANSVTDLSGISIRNPRAPLMADGMTRVATGRIIDGGSIRASSLFVRPTNLFLPAGFSQTPYIYFGGAGTFDPTGATPALTITAGANARVDLSGAADTFDIATGPNSFTPTAAWSNAGTLSALGGGDVTRAIINAHGGASQAHGGTFEWLHPVLVQGVSAQSGVVSANQVQAAGFDSFIARGDVTTIGNVNLTMARSFLLRARDYGGAPLASGYDPVNKIQPKADPYYAISFSATGDLSISTAHIGLLGIDQTVDSLAGTGQGTLALHGGSIDIFGAVAFRNSLSSVLLDSASDIRLIGVQPLARTLTPSLAIDPPSLSGQVIAGGDLTFRARQVYATTGSGNLQQLIESHGTANVRPYLIASAGADSIVRFESNGVVTPPIPYSAGSYLAVRGAHIEQAGVLRAPLGRLDLGSTSTFNQTNAAGQSLSIAPTQTLTLAAGSLTSISGGDLRIPYGTTTDLTEYYFTPGSSSPITALPSGELRLGGAAIAVRNGATVDASGGKGDLYAYEFVSGTGGSRDVLSRFNDDAFSSTNGYQYVDGRQVYAIVPVGTDVSALYDPNYSAGYGALYSGDVGKTVHLDGGNGVAAGDYMLLPAQYALLPGALRLVENVGAAAPIPGASATLRDGSVIVGGTYGEVGGGSSDWQPRSFTVQSQDVFRKYSRIELTSGTKTVVDAAKSNGTVAPRLPADAGRIVFNPLASLQIDGNFKTAALAGGRGSQVDIAADVIDLVSNVAQGRDGAVALVAGDLDKLNAASLFIGGVRTDRLDGSTDLAITTHEINLINDAAHPLRAPEILLAVDGADSILNIADGATITATGTLGDTRSGDYNVANYAGTGDTLVGTNSGAGSVLRLANGRERLVNRSGELAAGATLSQVTLAIGKARLSGDSLTIETSRNLTFTPGATLDVRHVALGGDDVSFAAKSAGLRGLVITPGLEQALAAAQSLNIRANGAIGFGAGEHRFKDLTLYAPGIRLIRATTDAATAPLTMMIDAANVRLGNYSGDAGACRGTAGVSCGSSGNTLVLNATSLSFGPGVVRTFGFDSSVALKANAGITYDSVGAFDVGAANLSLTTPFIVDRGNGAQPKTGASQADLALRTSGAVSIVAGSSIAPSTGAGAPGSRLAIGSLSAPVQRVTIDGTLLRATAGTIEAYSGTGIALTGSAKLATPSYSQTFGDAADPVTVSKNGGTIKLVARTGDITIGNAATLAIGGVTGGAGRLNLLASQGRIDLAGTIDAAAPTKGASLNYDSGLTAFDLPGFITGAGSAFTGDLAIRTGVGNLALNVGQTLAARSVNLTADGGTTTIGGKIDTSGINGGDIGLYARDGVSLLSSAALDAHASGYTESDTRRASGGDVTLGVGANGAIMVASAATINVAAARPGDRLVADQRVDPRTLNRVTAYTYVQGDEGGTLTLRAPVITQPGADTVNVSFAGALTGARNVSIEGYKRYNLVAIAANAGYTGVTVDSTGTAILDLASATANKKNFLADLGAGTLVDFIQNFDISAVRSRLGSLTTLAYYHERPGIELDYSGAITLASNWNLGAGTVNIPAALAAGDMKLSALGPYANGKPRYDVVAGREADLFQHFVSMTYRVGGKVSGEAGRLTLRAGGNLNIAHSISDGFFAFGDQTDPTFITAQLGGGPRMFNPALSLSCGNPTTDCGEIYPFDPAAGPVPSSNAIVLNLSNLVRGSDQNSGVAPYSAAANSPAALGQGAGGAGDPLGSAQIFPLLADGTPVDAFSIQLVGGAGASHSADPLHVDRGAGGNVVVSGESTYAIKADAPTAKFGGGLQFRFANSAQFLSGDLLSSLVDATQIDPDTLGALTTRVQFGVNNPAASQYMRAAATRFFAAYPEEIVYFGPAGSPTGFTAPLSRVIEFLGSTDASGKSLSDRFAAKINNGRFGYAPPAPGRAISLPGKFARVRTVIRTGTGSIDVAAAGSIDLRNGDVATILNQDGKTVSTRTANATQEGGSAINTVGHVIAPTLVAARISGTQDIRTIDPTNTVLGDIVRDAYVIPTASGRLQVQPAYLTGGGSVSLTAGEDILGRRDVFSEAFNSNAPASVTISGIDHQPVGNDIVGSADQRWRVGSIGVNQNGVRQFATNIRLNPQLFSSGVGTLGGGDVAIDAGRDVSELTVALDTSVTTGDVGSSFGSMVFGGGNLAVRAGHDILGGRFDISSGTASFAAGRNIGSSGQIVLSPQIGTDPATLRVANLPEIRLTDTRVAIEAGGAVRIGKVSALGVDSTDGQDFDHVIDANALGYYTGRSSVAIAATGNITLAGVQTRFLNLDAIGRTASDLPIYGAYFGSVMPASLRLTSFNGDLDLGSAPLLLYPGASGQLSLLAGGTLASATIDIDDGEASLLPGIFSAVNYDDSGAHLLFSGRPFSMPVVTPNTPDSVRRLFHAELPVHAGDAEPVRIAVGGSLIDTTLFSAKAARISAGGDIVNMMFSGQNVATDDVTRIVAGRDITATVAGATSSNTNGDSVLGRSVVQGNQFILGGPGSLYVEAGRNLGPFLGSSTVIDNRSGAPVRASYPGGILSVGNDFNPWIAPQGADINAYFGVAKGMDFAALREAYLNPANSSALDGDLFEQVSDPFGNKTPDRSKPIYLPILIAWMQANQPAALTATFGSTDVTATQAYSAFAALPELVQRKFLLDKIYFNELAAPSRPTGPSYLQYIRGYRAVNSLFSAALGYTTNDLGGASNGGARVSTGNLDLRLATIQTSRGGDVTILGPGGDAILGSVVRTSAQAVRRAYQPTITEGFDQASFRPDPARSYAVPVLDIPIGYEGVLTLRGGAIRGFTDGDIRLNQSRLFAQQGGDITLWSSNGDLNAGQGPKSAANVPPVFVRFDRNGYSELDSAGAVSGAGIAGFTAIRRRNPYSGLYEVIDPLADPDVVIAQGQMAGLASGSQVVVNGKTYRRDAPSITLIAPVGTVDAGDAGVRAGGDIFVAAARVANADNFKVGGASVGIPAAGGATAAPTPSNAASALTANVFRATNPNGLGEQRVRILVDVLGFYGAKDCPPDSTDLDCAVKQ